MNKARQAHIGDVRAGKDMVHQEARELRMGTVLPLRPPACDWRLCAPTELGVRFVKRAPSLPFASHLQLEQLPQVVTKRSDEGGILPAWAVAGTAEAIHATVWPPLHNHVPLELFQSLKRDFERMPIESAGLGVMVRGAGWQIAHCYGKLLEQP